MWTTPVSSLLLLTSLLVQPKFSEPVQSASEVAPAAYDADEAYHMRVQVIAKKFWLACRQQNGRRLSAVIDPEYLTKHELMEATLSSPPIETSNLYAMELAGDKNTILCQVEQKDDSVTVLVFRVVDRDGSLFVVPPQPPKDSDGKIVPWLLYTSLAAK